MAKKGAIKITPTQMMNHWVNAYHRFQVNIWNFEVEAARTAVDVFRGSFGIRRMNTDGSPYWEPRKRNYKHPILEDTGTLKNSIEWKFLNDTPGPKKGVRIYTNPNKFGTARRHKGFCYAAVHNSADPSFRTGRVANMPQRQFMGHSTVLDKRLRLLTPTIFKGMP